MNRSLNKLNQGEYWDKNLDSQNLGKENSAHYEEVMRGNLFFNTPDQNALYTALAPEQGKSYLEVGCGLGLNVLAVSEAGGVVFATDISLERLRALRNVMRRKNPDLKVFFVQAKGENLPFKSNSFSGVSARAVLIHTEIEKAYDEAHRVLKPEGRIAVAEPLADNAFVNLYRRYFAPKEWAEIATYFTESEIRMFQNRFLPINGSINSVSYFYFVSFFAFIFQFLLSMPRTFFVALRKLKGIDYLLFRIFPQLKKRCWFVVLTGKKES